MAALTSRFGTGELLIIGGAVAILGAEILLGWLLLRVSVPDAILLLTVLMLATVVFQRTGRVDVGTRYGAALMLLGVVLGFLVVDRLVFEVRSGFPTEIVSLLGFLATYLGGAAAAVGGFLVSRPGFRLGS